MSSRVRFGMWVFVLAVVAASPATADTIYVARDSVGGAPTSEFTVDVGGRDVGGWVIYTQDASWHEGAYSYFWLAGNSAAKGTFHFTGVAPGLYNVAATWESPGNRSSDAMYSLTENSTTLQYHADQTVLPTEPVYQSVPWKTMFTNVSIGDGTLDVSLEWGGGGSDQTYLSADAVRLTLVPEPSTLAMLVIGLMGLVAYAWRKRR